LIAKLRKAAEASGRSDSQEVEFRLGMSFRGLSTFSSLFGGEDGVWSFLLSAMSPSTRRQIKAGAKQSGRSIAQEIEFHIGRSLKGPEAYAHLFGGEGWLMGFHIMSIHMALAEQATGKRITEDQATFKRARKLAMKAFDSWFEPGRGGAVGFKRQAVGNGSRSANIARSPLERPKQGTGYRESILDVVQATEGKSTPVLRRPKK